MSLFNKSYLPRLMKTYDWIYIVIPVTHDRPNVDGSGKEMWNKCINDLTLIFIVQKLRRPLKIILFFAVIWSNTKWCNIE